MERLPSSRVLRQTGVPVNFTLAVSHPLRTLIVIIAPAVNIASAGDQNTDERVSVRRVSTEEVAGADDPDPMTPVVMDLVVVIKVVIVSNDGYPVALVLDSLVLLGNVIDAAIDDDAVSFVQDCPVEGDDIVISCHHHTVTPVSGQVSIVLKTIVVSRDVYTVPGAGPHGVLDNAGSGGCSFAFDSRPKRSDVSIENLDVIYPD